MTSSFPNGLQPHHNPAARTGAHVANHSGIRTRVVFWIDLRCVHGWKHAIFIHWSNSILALRERLNASWRSAYTIAWTLRWSFAALAILEVLVACTEMGNLYVGDTAAMFEPQIVPGNLMACS